MAETERRPSRLEQYRKERREFSMKVYILVFLFGILGLVHWLLCVLMENVKNKFKDIYILSVVSFALALILVTLFIFIEKLRFIKCLNWLFTIAIAECIILGVVGFAVLVTWKTVIICFVAIWLIIIIFILIGTYISHDLTLDVVILFVLAFIFFAGTVFFIMIFLMAGVAYSFIVYATFVSIIILMFVMYHAQTINGGRFAEMRVTDYLLAALIIFHDFVIIYMLTFYSYHLYAHFSEYQDNFNLTKTNELIPKMMQMEDDD